MGSSRQGPSKKAVKAAQGRGSSKSDQKKAPRGGNTQGKQRLQDESYGNQVDIPATIPLTLQQLLLNVFKSALLTQRVPSSRADISAAGSEATSANLAHAREATERNQLDIKGLIQTIKSHLYNRDFDSAFTDADEDLLRAYALRWSSSRALGYVGIFRALLKVLLKPVTQAATSSQAAEDSHVVCIGGGAGAEIIALAAAWRDWTDAVNGNEQQPTSSGEQTALADAVEGLSLQEGEEGSSGPEHTVEGQAASKPRHKLSVTAIDIADWSSIVDRLVSTIQSPAVTGSNSHPAPLYGDAGLMSPAAPRGSAPSFQVGFQRLDVLSASEDELRRLLRPSQEKQGAPNTVMVTLMFTLNELFSTSMAKATGFLLRLTDMLQPGAVLLVVDSPGSYSTLKLGKTTATGTATETSERQYPMKFLLDHALLSVAAGKWDRLFSQDSRWWRRDAARLRYEVGEGAGLEDMRFQVHIYRRLAD
ncbi:25S rRNA (uracil2843-N3)-methyltransferase [Aspergillus homomorphus CBS 101889]|uniref:25S rRNA (Uridine(2843)-N(3))-methyltransferase n=1 Tax=Aspergillus homomorphus (strain CBS 101889) TaxID=1450537 RepID=A0A395IAP5_ASPHC|nr:hypothetical protein BO97DRAFT_467595 [Aspergillus homomorphus CBS 101889]RAL17116.1 hypothetical protein BO97DRAFT_467595 [Aspergillus homomorphus CBS 101889]